jgi:hypothetical protein
LDHIDFSCCDRHPLPNQFYKQLDLHTFKTIWPWRKTLIQFRLALSVNDDDNDHMPAMLPPPSTMSAMQTTSPTPPLYWSPFHCLTLEMNVKMKIS